jgi:hypothetical protein
MALSGGKEGRIHAEMCLKKKFNKRYLDFDLYTIRLVVLGILCAGDQIVPGSPYDTDLKEYT